MRYLMAIVLILLLATGSVLFFYLDDAWALGLPAFYFVGRQAAVRLVWRACWFLVILSVMPDDWRHAYMHLCNVWKQLSMHIAQEVRIVWDWAPWPLKALMIVAAAMCSGLCAFTLFIVPVHVTNIPFVGLWLRDTGLPYLMRSATAKSIELNLPVAWVSMPTYVRQRVRKPYMRVWWWTARRLVHSRQALGRRAAYLHRKRNSEI